ncbi:MAG: flagellar rod assembly protein/muramidase FlgJ [Cycloclasticus sp. symbiont of Bathymodiolus heckerae]|nr:MAG: flagellar rod assembly protein/muramidase FlgJ [Cycloclasticus sp. symbiont of Bathymodiolus heckerae]
MTIANVQAEIYADFNGLAQLRHQASKDQGGAIDEVARQFETIFVKMMLKSMRDAVSESALINTDKQKFYQSMYDDQISLNLTQSGGLGLGEMIKLQLGGGNKESNETAEVGLSNYRDFAVRRIHGALQEPQVKEAAVLVSNIKSPEDFINKLWPQAQEAAQELGVDAKVLLAQSALETGWGQHIMKGRTGENSHNLFGIKATPAWQGKTVSVQTVEYEEGIAVKRQATFRAYDSYQESFNDYVNFLQQNPRYQQALDKVDSSEGFIKGLQKAGYATDPAYAKKIISILGREHLSSLNGGLNLQNKATEPLKG